MSPQTMQALAGSLGSLIDHPVARMAKKYWYLSFPLGLGLYGKLRERYEAGGKVHQYLADTANVISPILTIVAVFELAEKMESKGKLRPQMAQARDVEYEIQQPQEAQS